MSDDDNIIPFSPDAGEAPPGDRRWLKGVAVVVLICVGFFVLVETRNRTMTRNTEAAIAYLEQAIAPGHGVAEVEAFLVDNGVEYARLDGRESGGKVQPNQIRILFKDVRVGFLVADSVQFRILFDDEWVVTGTASGETHTGP